MGFIFRGGAGHHAAVHERLTRVEATAVPSCASCSNALTMSCPEAGLWCIDSGGNIGSPTAAGWRYGADACRVAPTATAAASSGATSYNCIVEEEVGFDF